MSVRAGAINPKVTLVLYRGNYPKKGNFVGVAYTFVQSGTVTGSRSPASDIKPNQSVTQSGVNNNDDRK